MAEAVTPSEVLLERIADRLDVISDQLGQAPARPAPPKKKTTKGSGKTVPVDGR